MIVYNRSGAFAKVHARSCCCSVGMSLTFFPSGGRLEMGTFLFPWRRGGWGLGITATTSPAEIDASCPHRNVSFCANVSVSLVSLCSLYAVRCSLCLGCLGMFRCYVSYR